MSKKNKISLVVIVGAALLVVAGVYLSRTNIPVLEPAGSIGAKERNLIVVALLLSIIVVVPTFILTIYIVWKYRESNERPKKYHPDWDHSRLFESVWWGIPLIIITILSVITWNSSHALDPFRSLVSTKKPLQIQVVALDWKWLFIYPDQNLASVNGFEIPLSTPVNFQITSDTVMNSFWIPQLGDQIYAMPGMNTQLNLMANKAGTYNGSSANISGSGFASMTFKVSAVSQTDFDQWVQQAKQSTSLLNLSNYNQLTKPSVNNPVTYYSSVQSGLFDWIVMKYMAPMSTPASGSMSQPLSSMPSMNGMSM